MYYHGLHFSCTKAKLQFDNVKLDLCNSLSIKIINTVLPIKLSDSEIDFNDDNSNSIQKQYIFLTFILYIVLDELATNEKK